MRMDCILAGCSRWRSKINFLPCQTVPMFCPKRYDSVAFETWLFQHQNTGKPPFTSCNVQVYNASGSLLKPSILSSNPQATACMSKIPLAQSKLQFLGPGCRVFLRAELSSRSRKRAETQRPRSSRSMDSPKFHGL